MKKDNPPEKQEEQLKPLLVTTLHKGVFFGYGLPTTKKIITLKNAQMCIYWAASIRGVLGLASVGPDNNCKVSFPVPSITLQEITSVSEVSKESEEKWKLMPWA